MDINDILEFNYYLQDLLGNKIVYALGGYPSLIAQGILPKERESKDIDICIFNPKKFNNEIFSDFGEYLSCEIRDNLSLWNSYLKFIGNDRQYYHEITCSLLSHDKLDLSNNQKNRLYNDLGINKSISIEFRELKQRKNYKNIYDAKELPNLGRISSNDYLNINGITEETIYSTTTNTTYPNFIYGTEINCNEEDLLDAKKCEEEKIKISEEIFNELKSKYKLRGAFIFDYLMRNNEQKELNFDIFVSTLDRLKKNTVVINGYRYVHYYVILRAKYEYCLNEATNEEQFNKHVRDLALSYDKVHIKGINTPNDIEALHLKRLKINDK